MSYLRMKRQTELYKKMAGLPFKDVTDEMINAEEAYLKQKGKVESLKAKKAEEKVISVEVSALASVEYRYRQLLIGLEKSKS